MNTQLDVRGMAPSERDRLIAEGCSDLHLGEVLVLVNDHDPRMLCRRLDEEHPGDLNWKSLEEEPGTWRVIITRPESARQAFDA